MLKFLCKTKRLVLIGSVLVLLPPAYAESNVENVDDETTLKSKEVKKPAPGVLPIISALTTPKAVELVAVEVTPKLVVKSENITGKEQALLNKVKAERQAKRDNERANNAASDSKVTSRPDELLKLQSEVSKEVLDEAAQYKLAPGESVVKNNDDKKKSSKKTIQNKSVEDIYIDKLEFRQANMLDVSRALADISGLNFVATEEAAKKNVTVFLQNISVKNALEAITKNAGLWYRRDKESGTFRIMSTKEYQQDLIVYREDTTRVFNLLHPNPMIVASSIRDLYGSRVILSFGMQDMSMMGMGGGGARAGGGAAGRGGMAGMGGVGMGGMGGNGMGVNRTSVQGRGRSNMGGMGLGAGGNANRMGGLNNENNIIQENLTADQIERLNETIDDKGDVRLNSDDLKGINNRQQPIYITINREHDLMTVRTSDNGVMKEIEQLVKELDRPTRQVLLEMKILSLDVGDSYRQSVDLDFMPSSKTLSGPITDQAKNPLGTIAPINVTNTTTTDNGSGSTSTQTQNGVINLGVRNILGLGNFALEGGTFVYQFMNDSIRARIQLLQQNNRINTLSTPVLLSSNNKPARVFVGTEQVVTTGFDAVSGGASVAGVGAPAIIPITEIRDIGNTLQVMPKINSDKTVSLFIQQDSSTLIRGGSIIPIPVGNSVQSFNVDSVRTSNIQGTVVAKDGLTIAIGGLIDSSDSEDEQKVPLLGDIPILGELFKRKVKQKSKRELLLLITPHIIESAHDSEDLTRDAIAPLSEQTW